MVFWMFGIFQISQGKLHGRIKGHLMFWNRRSWTFHISVQILKYICASSQFSSPNSSTKCLHSSSSPRKNLQKSTCPRGERLWNSRMTSNKKQTYKQKKTRTENISWRQNKGNGARFLSGMKPKDRIWKQEKSEDFPLTLFVIRWEFGGATFKLNGKKTRKRIKNTCTKIENFKSTESVLTLNVSGHVISEGRKGLLQ